MKDANVLVLFNHLHWLPFFIFAVFERVEEDAIEFEEMPLQAAAEDVRYDLLL